MAPAPTRREPVLRSVDAARGAEPHARSAEAPTADVLLVTTPALEGRAVVAHLGLASGQAVRDASLLGETGRRRGLFRARTAAPEEVLAEGRDDALRELRARAAAKGADAVLAVSVTQAVLGPLLVVTATGTAVRLG